MFLASRGAALLFPMGPTIVVGPTETQGGAQWAGMPGTELLCAAPHSGEGADDIASRLLSWKDPVVVLQSVARALPPGCILNISAATLCVALQLACQAMLQTILRGVLRQLRSGNHAHASQPACLRLVCSATYLSCDTVHLHPCGPLACS